ncbi:threonine/serine exporter family protein [Paenibacillus thermotolerans]|uniref:threonine/serine exporter family protein n=1 Tax=Paenibacillus thermotolerans TaxID=3027807 RepID=UPI002368AD1C|nr:MULTISPECIES: threonine/serine exporter family protein [unclassified Paenibacillus]
MDSIVVHAVTSFIASAAFGLLFYAPLKSLVHCGFIGMMGWMTYVFSSMAIDPISSTLAASFVVTIIGHVFSKAYRTPIIVYSVSGIIPLVPGGLAYDAMRQFVQKAYSEALVTAAQAFLISGSIAVGLLCSEVIHQALKHRR